MLQPEDAGKTIIRGMLEPRDEVVPLLRRINDALRVARADIQEAVATLPTPDPIPPRYDPVSQDLADMPELVEGGAKIRVRVASKTLVAKDVVALELAPLSGLLPASQPGAHIDVALPNGLTRQYSLVNVPGETDRYVIAVKREAKSTGGSEAIHGTLHQGDLLAVSEPRNNFTLRRDAEHTILIAGGIGVTPLLSMAAALQDDSLSFDLHYFAGEEGAFAFPERLAALGGAVQRHTGLTPDATRAALTDLLSGKRFATQIYVCGPAPMLDSTREVAKDLGWPDEAVHFEYFANPNEIDTGSSFRIELARSALSLDVPAGKSVLSVLHENGVSMASSCGQGACGTCMVRVIEGEIEHQDVYLNDAEKAAGDKMMTCVSRAKSDRLILDL